MTEWQTPNPGPWQQDSAHAPAAGTAAVRALYPQGFNRGFSETCARYGLLLDRLAMADINGFTYHQPQPFDMPGPDGPLTPEQIGAEIGRRAAIAEQAFETKLWRQDLELWDDVCKPEAIATHRAFADVDLGSLTDDELADHLRNVGNHLSEMVYQHHRFNVAALLPVGDFAVQVAGWTGRPPMDSVRGARRVLADLGCCARRHARRPRGDPLEPRRGSRCSTQRVTPAPDSTSSEPHSPRWTTT